MAHALALAMLCAGSAGAQQVAQQGALAAGRLEGTAFDSLTSAPLAGALVWVPARAADRSDGAGASAVTDSAGRWALAGLTPGRVAIAFSHPALDSLGLTELRAEADVVAGAARRLALASPSYATLAARLCPGGVAADSGIVFGSVADGRGTLLEGARLEAAWDKLTDPRAPDFGASQARWAATDARGVYALCGVPVDQVVTAVAVAGGARTGLLDVLVPPSRLLRLDLVVGTATPGRAIPADSAAPAVVAPRPAGEAALEGIARDSAGNAVAGAVIALREVEREARGDPDGRFRLIALPEGTHMVDVFAVGYAPERRRVDLGRGRPATLDVTLRRAVTLNTVTVRAAATTRFYAALDRRRALGQGVIRRGEQIANHPSVATVLREIPRTVVAQGRGTSSVYLKNGSSACAPLIYLDGVRLEQGAGGSGSLAAVSPFPAIAGDTVRPVRRAPPSRSAGVSMGNLDQLPPPHELAGVELYRSISGIPAELTSGFSDCGALYVWTKQYAGRRGAGTGR